MPETPRPGDQQLPVPNDSPGAHDLLIGLLTERKQLGLDRYGSLLQPHNGRDTGRDLEEELLDAVVYTRTMRCELHDLESALRRLLAVWDMTPGEEKIAAMRGEFAATRQLLNRRGAAL